MKYLGLVLVVLAAGCEAGGPETKRVIRVRGVGWSDPTTYALVSVDPNGGPDSPENQLLVQKLDEALQSRGFRQVDLSRAEQIIQLRYRAEFDSTSGAGLAAEPAGQEEASPVAGVVEPAGANAGRFSISLKACDGPTLRFTGTRVIEMWRLTAEVTNVNDASEAIPILAGIARKYLATETVDTVKVTERIRAASPPATAKSATAS
jgi:hypothetical protein